MLDKRPQWSVAEETIGQRVRRLRESEGLSRKALERLVGISDQAIYLIETGRRQNMHPATVEKLAAALHVSEFYLLTGREPSENEPLPPDVAHLYKNLSERQRRMWLRIGRLLREEQEPYGSNEVLQKDDE